MNPNNINLSIMKRLLTSIISLGVLGAGQAQELPRIAIAGISIESSTFSPAVSTEDMFRKRTGDALMDYYAFLREGTPARSAAQWMPVMVAAATPGGAVTRETYDSLTGQILDGLREAMPLDALFFDIHGAMSVVGMDDPEGDLLIKIREVIGSEPLVSTCMDPHGNPTWRLATNTDLITCYRTAPHEDYAESRERAVNNLLERLASGKGRPKYKAWIPVPILLPGEKTSTRVEPARSLYAAIAPATGNPGVIDAAIWIGYAWADEPRNHAVVMAVGDDRGAVTRTAEYLANFFWDVRHGFEFVAPTASLDECLAVALKSDTKPYFISDMGDNPTAGGAGDVTWTLNELLKRRDFAMPQGKTLLYASIPGPELVAQAKKVGAGGRVKGYVGAQVDARYSGPVQLNGQVVSIVDDPENSEAAVRVGSMIVIVTEKRKGYHYERDFARHGIDPRQSDIVMVKMGYLVPEWYNMQRGWMMALTRGGVDQDLLALPYRRIARPMFPLDPGMPDPDLSARLVPGAGE
jgi:microcystin degradation protein MlrC